MGVQMCQRKCVNVSNGRASVPMMCYPEVLQGNLQEWYVWVLWHSLVLLSLRMLCIDFHGGYAGFYSQEQ